VTQGAHPTIVACEGKTVSFEVPHVPSEEIVDSNGAGDGPWFLVGLCFDLLAFVGGLLACLALDKSLEDGIHAGHYCASFILRRSGTSLPGKPDYKL
jgi:adenosine kinase